VVGHDLQRLFVRQALVLHPDQRLRDEADHADVRLLQRSELAAGVLGHRHRLARQRGHCRGSLLRSSGQAGDLRGHARLRVGDESRGVIGGRLRLARELGNRRLQLGLAPSELRLRCGDLFLGPLSGRIRCCLCISNELLRACFGVGDLLGGRRGHCSTHALCLLLGRVRRLARGGGGVGDRLSRGCDARLEIGDRLRQLGLGAIAQRARLCRRGLCARRHVVDQASGLGGDPRHFAARG
jgi:hypothetical protein